MRDFFEMLQEAEAQGKNYAVAIVVHTEGSTSGKPGAKAVIQQDGTILGGWLGGGCVESAVVETAKVVMRSGVPKMITLDLTDEFSGLGMPCGGKMWVYIEPKMSPPTIVVVGSGTFAQAIAKLAVATGFPVIVDDSHATPEQFPYACSIISDDLDYTNFPVSSNTFVVIATQHKADDRSMEAAIRKGAKYIALIASRKRAGIVLNTLRSRGISEGALATVHAPAGLDIGAQTPEEVAISILAEIVYEIRKKQICPLSLTRGKEEQK